MRANEGDDKPENAQQFGGDRRTGSVANRSGRAQLCCRRSKGQGRPVDAVGHRLVDDQEVTQVAGAAAAVDFDGGSYICTHLAVFGRDVSINAHHNGVWFGVVKEDPALIENDFLVRRVGRQIAPFAVIRAFSGFFP